MRFTWSPWTNVFLAEVYQDTGQNLFLLGGRRVFDGLHVRKVMIFLVTRRLAKFKPFLLHRKGQGPGPRVHHRIADGGLVVDGVGTRRRESFHYMFGVAPPLAALA